METKETQTDDAYARPERRIAWLTLLLGGAAAAGVAVGVSPRAAAGVVVGTLLAWANLRWLQQALDALVRLATAQAGKPQPRVSIWVYIKFFARYALIALLVYAMVARFRVPILSLLAGLCAVGAAALAESVYEIFVPPGRG